MEVRVVLSYAPEDLAHRDVLIRHLEPLQKAGTLRLWHDGDMPAGHDRGAVLRAELERAQIVLLLVSADYLGSEDCRMEMERALERVGTKGSEGANVLTVVPVLLRPCLVGFDRIAKLSALPANGRPVTVWPDRDSAWNDVAHGVAALVTGATVGPASEASLQRSEVERLHVLAKLEDARVRRGRLEAARAITGDVDAEILKLKRDLREGGQVQQGDLLRGRYTLLRRIGRGGFATVWEAEDREARARVAIKILHPDLGGDTLRRERFFRGARIMSELGHEAIVRILSTEQQDGGFHFLVMEHLACGDLHTAVLEGRIPPERVVPLIARVGEALTAAHEHPKRFIHRDVKPANILLDDAGDAKLGDFDLVGGKETTGGTRTGAMGSFLYAAPEVLSRPQDADQRADVFGLGMTALFCLHGKPLTDEAFFDPRSVLDATGRPALAAVIAKAIERKPADRFADVRSFCAALKAAEASEHSATYERANDESEATSAADDTSVDRAHDEPARVVNEPAPGVEAAQPSLGIVTLPTTGTSPREKDTPPPRHAAKASPARPILAAIALILGALVLTMGFAWPEYFTGGPHNQPTPEWVNAPLEPEPAMAAPTATPSVPSGTVASAGTPGARGETAVCVVGSACPPGMAYEPAGTFRMGSDPSDPDADDDEKKPHDVTLSAFCIDVAEVRVADYWRCTKEVREGRKCAVAPDTVHWDGGDVRVWSQFCNGNRPDRYDHPINCVDWTMADTYCRWAGRALPSEAQWEYAARGRSGRKYPWGTDPPGPALLNACGSECRDMLGAGWSMMYAGDDGASATALVQKYPEGATPEGVYDLAGNVWEWVQDMKADYDPFLSKDPVQTKGVRRVLRGGGWSDDVPRNVRAAARWGYDGGGRHHSLGFRCACGSNP